MPPMVRFPDTVPAIPALSLNVRPMPQSKEMTPVELSPVMRALPLTPPPKLALTVAVIVGMEVFTLQLNAKFPDVPTPGTEAIPGAEIVPVTSNVEDPIETSEMHLAPTFASGSETMFRNFNPSVNGLLIGAITSPTETPLTLDTDDTVHVIPDALTIGEINCAQLMSAVMSPAPVGSGGNADT